MKKLLCKKLFHIGSEIYFKIGETYEVYAEDEDGCWVITHLAYQNKGVDMVEKFFKTKVKIYDRYLYDYFYTNQEVRKRKLNKLNEKSY
jgi:hypothetical protein